jgi:hypothetical protein
VSQSNEPKPPTLLDAILPVVVLIGLIALTIVLFGVSATDGPLQVALLLSAAFASLIAFKNGYTPLRSRRLPSEASRPRWERSSSSWPSGR